MNMKESEMTNLTLLKELCEIPAIAGREHKISSFIRSKVSNGGMCDEAWTDPMGNFICKYNSTAVITKPKKVLILCHMDEIGFMVNHVTDDGFIHVEPLGGFDPRNLFSRRVRLVTDKEEIVGVMNPSGLPIHLAKAEDTKKVPGSDEFIIDIGDPNAKDRVQVGDWCVMEEPFLDMGDRVVSKALDNRVACYLGMEILREYEPKENIELYVAFTTQEEVGLRGAKTASFGVDADVVIGLDVTLACDTPGVPSNKTVSKLGEGYALGIRDSAMIADKGLVDEFVKISEDNNIPFQRVAKAGGGQDAAAGQQATNGAKAIAIAVGTRYIHTVTEMLDKRDLQAALDVVNKYLEK